MTETEPLRSTKGTFSNVYVQQSATIEKNIYYSGSINIVPGSGIAFDGKTITNIGTLTGGTIIAGSGLRFTGATLVNTGTLAAGVGLSITSGVITNTGTLAPGVNTEISSGSIGVPLYAGSGISFSAGTIANTGQTTAISAGPGIAISDGSVGMSGSYPGTFNLLNNGNEVSGQLNNQVISTISGTIVTSIYATPNVVSGSEGYVSGGIEIDAHITGLSGTTVTISPMLQVFNDGAYFKQPINVASLATFNDGITGTGNTGALTAGSGILNTANTFGTLQTFNDGITGTGNTGALTAGSGILNTANTFGTLQTFNGGIGVTGPVSLPSDIDTTDYNTGGTITAPFGAWSTGSGWIVTNGTGTTCVVMGLWSGTPPTFSSASWAHVEGNGFIAVLPNGAYITVSNASGNDIYFIWLAF